VQPGLLVGGGGGESELAVTALAGPIVTWRIPAIIATRDWCLQRVVGFSA
jgi:hypothetical protein